MRTFINFLLVPVIIVGFISRSIVLAWQLGWLGAALYFTK